MPASQFLPGFVTLLFLSACTGSTSPEPDTLARQMLIVDTHIDVPYRLEKHYEDVSGTTERGDFDYPRAVHGGLNVPFMSIYIPANIDRAGAGVALAEKLIDGVEDLADRASNKFARATCVADIDRNFKAQKISLPMGMENGGPMATSESAPQHFFQRGIRYVTLTHSKWNALSDSSYDSDEHWLGLSEAGKSMITRLNRLGIMVDVSHISDKAFWQVIQLSRVPVIASHSSARFFTPDFQRNMSDDMIKALAEQGGVIQINTGSGFLTQAARDYSEEMKNARQIYLASLELAEDSPLAKAFYETYREEHPYPFARLDDVLDHIEHAVKLGGIEHVGIGSDFDGVGDSLPKGFKSVADYPNLIAGLLGRGYLLEDIEKILGRNLMRVWAEVESYAITQGQEPLCANSV